MDEECLEGFEALVRWNHPIRGMIPPQIAIDDFGTGYSSLPNLQSMPIDHLKIDRSFISGVQQSQENDQIVRSIISLARSLGLSVIAEGVETRNQLEKLRALHCDKAQGFMFSRPVDERKARELIGVSHLLE